jgi:hypothetical protein
VQAPILYNFDDFEQLEGFNTFQKKINVSIGMLLALVMGYSLSKFCENKKIKIDKKKVRTYAALINYL